MSGNAFERETAAPLAEVSVVIPAFNEGGTIRAVVEGARAHTPGLLEVLVVDDGSTDGTSQAATEAGARVLVFPKNRGKGVALREGAAQAKGALLVFLDADGQDDPHEIPTLLDALTDDVDMVIGSRFLGTFHDGAITRVNRLGSMALLTLLNRLFDARITDPFAGFRAVRRASLEACDLRAERFDIEVDVLLALLARGCRVVEVPVSRYAREHGTTRLSAIRDGLRILGRIVGRRLERAQ